MSSLEVLVAQHRQKLTELYTLISPQPTELVTAQLDALQALLGATIDQQRLCAENERDQIQASLDKSWEKVGLWRTALGEDASIGKGRGTGPLKTLVQEVEEVLQSMRGRMEERGKQILGLNSRIATFVPTLGREWLQVSLDDVEQGWEALDLRLERMSALEREVMRCETEIARRRDAINANVNEIFALRSELGIHQGDGTTTDDFDEAILAHLGIGEGRERKELEPTSENIARAEAKRKWVRCNVQLGGNRPRQRSLTDGLLSILCLQLEDEKNQRNMTIQTTYDKLYPLWTMLGVSEYEMEQFVNTHMGSTQDVVMAYQDELARMLTLKRSNLSAFIQRERVALSNLWDALYLSMPQRIASFPPLQVCIDSTRVWNEVTGAEEEIINNNVSEELLVAHERERERVEAEVERCQPVLERLGKYFSVVEEMAQLEASASDPSRLLGKSTRGDPGRLLREEKARKRVVKEKPRLEAELRQFIPAWEQQNQRPFLVNGVRFLDDLENKMGAEMAEKENKKVGRLQLRTDLDLGLTLSTSHTLQREKMGTKSTTTIRPLQSQMTGASSVGPLKRQMTGRSATGTSTTGGPAAKRQTPMATGGVPRAVAVVDHAPQLYQQAAAHPMVVGGPTKLVPQMTGMKLPSGWGAPAAVAATEQYGYQPTAQYGMAPQTQYSMPPLRAQPTGGFRPGPRA
ncbi:BZ3500_MvSof-1268-A1-R1_Chr4-3g07255 [Microbotryum saponariae]|uniref:BZ3500_MvSof-1268-A1-R1_Chr4-3g07255 protein n=1 Tax=Microbotryum saponariae TaxID=289078 RepID=A0A2X0KTU3_9BASI|nr:BZ3500_MvSof-1268-A1-R1_Chr4-3g07255 [Microbotryum saponariae]SDA06918.1 BZ3501_MvSof-1269-A2-R1_Chr4-2g06964 [Microbotryum saponariae]